LTLPEIDERLVAAGAQLGLEVRSYQSNSEGALIDALHEARGWAAGVIFNPAGYTHTSVALRDAVTAIGLPVVEVHLSNVYAREDFRQVSLLAPVCLGKITGFGWRSYCWACTHWRKLKIFNHLEQHYRLKLVTRHSFLSPNPHR
jgi:3-dehydroquinate dehydratase-2